MAELIFFRIALGAYLLSTIGYIASLLAGRVRVARASMWVFALAFVLHTVPVVARWLGAPSAPSAGIYGSLSFISWVVSGLYLVFQTRTKTQTLGAFVSPMVVVMMIAASAGLMDEPPIPLALRGTLVTFHIVLQLTGGAFFALACLAGTVYLVQDRLIRGKNVAGFSRLLPPLHDLDRINHLCTVWGFTLMTLGIIAGSIWARSVWGSEWHWDPKQIFTTVSWILYAILVHQRIAIGWKGRKAAFLSIIAFAGLVFAFIGVNALFVTMHRF